MMQVTRPFVSERRLSLRCALTPIALRVQFSSQGQWGKGLYFARDAGYSDFYATKAGQIADRHDLQEGEKEMMLADLVLGNVIEMDRNVSGNAARTDPAMDACCRELTAPPAMNGCKVKRAYDGVDRCKGPPEHGGTKDQGHKYNTVRTHLISSS